MLTTVFALNRPKLNFIIGICLIHSTLFGQALSKKDSVWIQTSDGCKIHNPHPVKNETISWSGKCADGYADGEGTLIWFKNGKKVQEYNGQMKRGSPHGKGKYDYLDGSTHEGEYVKGELEGHALIIDKNKKDITTYYYDGEFKNGSPHGYGVEIYFYSNGDTSSVYKGNFSDWYNKAGAGLLKEYHDNLITIVKGEFKNNKAEGIIETSDYLEERLMLYYKGNFKNGTRNGYGEDVCGVNKYLGEWKENERTGKGKLLTDSVLIYDGEWENSRFNGIGKRVYFDGSYYFGEFEKNERNGLGVMHWKDGTKYVGEFKKELFEGLGYTSKELMPGPSGVWQKGMLLTTDTYRNIKQQLLEKYKKKILQFDY